MVSKHVAMIPSLGRPATDFDPLASLLESRGYIPVLVEPRPSWDGPATLHDLAADTVAQLDAQNIASFHLIGHAFGNRLSRCITADFNHRVESLTLLAAGGLVEPEAHIWTALAKSFDPSLSDEDHMANVSLAFFCEGNDATVWRDGWNQEVSVYQRAAVLGTPRDDWWGARADHVLVVQALQDVIAPVGNGRRYVAEHAPHARLVEINGSGHAMLPEQPDAIADAVIGFLENIK
jgi:pimeloyl-ACP methyl ester carboxylesterase